MVFKNLSELEEAKRTIKSMLKKCRNEYVKSVFKEMLVELEKGDVEMEATPSYISILRFSYDIFNPLHRL